MRPGYFLVLLGAGCVFAAGCATTGGQLAAPGAPSKPPSFFDRTLREATLLVGGQPTKADFEAFKGEGVTEIVNLRTPAEMKDVDFDEPALAASLGLDYVNLPVEGVSAYTPELLEAFARRVEQAKGKIVLHCTVGARAGQLYAAYSVKYLGKTPEEALLALKPLGGWPLPLERLLGRPLTVQFKETSE